MSRRNERARGKAAEPDLLPRGWAEAEGAVIQGWARDPLTNGPATLFLTVDEAVAARLDCNQHLAKPGVPAEATDAGFRVTLPKALEDDRPHRLSLRFPSGQALPFRSPSGASVSEWIVQLPGRYALEGVVDGLVGAALCGWIIRRNLDTGRATGGETVEILHEGRRVGQVVASLFRPDVAEALECEPNCGFSFVLPASLRNGQHSTLTVRAAVNGEELQGSPAQVHFLPEEAIRRLSSLFEEVNRICSQNYALRDRLRQMLDMDEFSVGQYNEWAALYFPKLRARVRERLDAAGRAAGSGCPPLVSVVCPVYKPEPAALDATICSVRRQTYVNWELILVDDGGKSAPVTRVLERHAREDKRVRLLPQLRNAGISAATNVAIAAARGRYVAFLDHDDLIEDVALDLMVAEALQTGAKALYSDEDKIQADGVLSEPHLKPDWNHRLLLSNNYVCHFLVVERETLMKETLMKGTLMRTGANAGPLDAAYDGAQDHDLVLRLAELLPAGAIRHVPEILYHWRKSANSTALRQDTKGYAADAGQRAVTAHLARRGLPGRAAAQNGTTRYAVEWFFKEAPSISILIPFRDQADITKACVGAILGTTRYPHYEVVLVDNWSTHEETRTYCQALRNEPRVRQVRIEEEFNYSRINNLAAATCQSDYLLFLNNDVVIKQADWLDRLVAEALADPTVGGVGAKLLYPNGTVQHAGVVLGVGGIADHAFRGLQVDHPGYAARAVSAQQISAVTAACLLCRASAFREVRGFDEDKLKIVFNDVDLCLRLGQAGWKIIYTPSVVAEHHESLSRGSDLVPDQQDRFYAENETMRERWGALIADDPFYSPHFSRAHGMFNALSSKPPPRRA